MLVSTLNAKFGFDTDVVRVDATPTEVKRGQPVLINYKWPTTAWDEIESGIVGLCAWEAYDGGQGLGTEGGAFVEQLVVALRRGGIGAMMLRTMRRSGRAAGGRVELQAAAAAAAAAAAKTSKEAVVEEGGARGRERKAGGDTRRRRSERGERRGRQGTTERAERDDVARDEGERT